MYPCLAPCHLVNGLKKCSRLLELRTLKFYDPDENNTLKSSMISVLLLDTIINMCTDMRCTFTSCWARQMVREELGVCRDSPLSEAEMQNVLRDLGEFDKFAKATKGIMKRRQQNVLTRSKAKQLDSLVYKKLMKQLAADVQRACIPAIVQTKLLQHEAMYDHFDSRMWGCKMPGILGQAVTWFKIRQFDHYVACETGLGAVVSPLPRVEFMAIMNLLVLATVLYLLFCSFYIFLYQVSVQDNMLIFNILSQTAMSDLVEVLITGPGSLIVIVGLTPLIMFSLIAPDISRGHAEMDKIVAKLEEEQADDDEATAEASHKVCIEQYEDASEDHLRTMAAISVIKSEVSHKPVVAKKPSDDHSAAVRSVRSQRSSSAWQSVAEINSGSQRSDTSSEGATTSLLSDSHPNDHSSRQAKRPSTR